MCTVSWAASAGHLVVAMNRDERTTRAPAEPPRAGAIRGVEFVAPRDGDHGGTWALVNVRGLVLVLLNRYTPPVVKGPFTSRGLLVMDLADAATPQDVVARLDARDLLPFAPFTLAAFAPGHAPRAGEWDGAVFTPRVLGDDDVPLVSSGYDAGRVASERRALFARARAERPLDGAALAALHASHRPERGPLSICMHRPEASTVSMSRIEVAPAAVRFFYHDGPPCTPSPTYAAELSRDLADG